MKASSPVLSICIAMLLLLGSVDAAVGGRPPRDDDPPAAGALYGDLYVLERDGDGVPILYPFEYLDPENGDTVEVECARPLAGECSDMEPPLADCQFIPLNVEKDDFDPEVEDACGPQVAYSGCLQEVSFGRGSVARSQPFVIDSAYSEVLRSINEATEIARDAAGRFVFGRIPDEGEPLVWKTIDAPLENLGLYREVMRNGCLGTVIDEEMGEGGVPIEVVYALDESAIDLLCGGPYDAVCADGLPYSSLLCEYPDFGIEEEWWTTPETPDPNGVDDHDLLWATTFIAGATDKANPLGLDEIININTYLGINTWTWIKVKRERILTVTYFDFDDFAYEMDEAFDPTTQTHLLTWNGGPDFVARDLLLFADPVDGVDLAEVGLRVCRNGEVRMDEDALLVCDSRLDEPYLPDDLLGCGGANFFAQAAEYARKTIWYVHNWEVPEIEY